MAGVGGGWKKKLSHFMYNPPLSSRSTQRFYFSTSPMVSVQFPNHPILSTSTLLFPFMEAKYDGRSLECHQNGKKVTEWVNAQVNGMQLRFGFVDHEIMSQIICVLCARGYHVEAVEALVIARRAKVKPKIQVYSSIINLLQVSGRHEMALQVFDVMRRDGFKPGASTYVRAIDAAAKTDRHDLTIQLFQQMMDVCGARTNPGVMRQLLVVSCNSVMGSCLHHLDMDTANELLCSMFGMNIPRTRVTYSNYLHCAIRCEKYDDIMHGVRVACDEGVELYPALIISVIQALARHKMWKSIVELYEIIESKSPDKTKFRALLNGGGTLLGNVLMALNKVNRPDATLALYEACTQQRVSITPFAYGSVMSAMLKTGKISEALDLCNNVIGTVEDPQCESPNRGILYICKVQLLIANDDIAHALHVLNTYKHLMDKTAICYRPLIAWYLKRRMYDEASRYTSVLMKENKYLKDIDYIHGLTAGMALPDKSSYWKIRQNLEARSPQLIPDIPKDLMLEFQVQTLASSMIMMDQDGASHDGRSKKLSLLSSSFQRASFINQTLPRGNNSTPRTERPVKF